MKGKIKTTLLITVLLISTLAIAIPAFAVADVYVDGIGAAPPYYATIQEGIVAVDECGTVHVAAGIYTEYVTIGKPLTLQGEDRDTTIIDATGGIGISITSDDVAVKDMQIVNGKDIGIQFGESISHITIDNNIIKNNDQAAGPQQGQIQANRVILNDIKITNNIIQSEVTRNNEQTGIRLNEVSGVGFIITDNQFIGAGDTEAAGTRVGMRRGIYLKNPSPSGPAGILSDILIADNKFIDCNEGILLDGGNRDNGLEDVTIEDNKFIRHNYSPICFFRMVKDVTITDNVFGPSAVNTEGRSDWDWPAAICHKAYQGAGTINGLTIQGNSFERELTAISLSLTLLGDITINFNNFVDLGTNLDGSFSSEGYGVKLTEISETIDANLNWWGTTVQSEIIEMVSGPVDFNPWLPADVITSFSDDDEDDFDYYEEVALGTDPNDGDDYPGAPVEEYLIEDVVEGIGTVVAKDEANTEVYYEATEDTTITVSKYEDNPEEKPSGFSALDEYIDVRVDEPENLDSIKIRLYYTEAGFDVEQYYRMYYWDGSAWVQCSDTGVETDPNYIWAEIDSTTRPDLSYLSGGPFGGGKIKLELDSEWYKTGDTVDVRVEDSAEEGIIMVLATSTKIAPLEIIIALHEEEPGIFTGEFLLVDYNPGGGELLVEHGDMITVTYLGAIGYEAWIDDLEPVISDLSPADESYADAKPEISATLDDTDSGIDVDTAVMKVDGVAVEAIVTEVSVSYTPSDDLTEGIHTVTVDVSDMVDKEAETAEWSFTVDTKVPLIEDAKAKPSVLYPETADTIVFMATVTDATSGVESVTIELGPIGGALVPMLDDGAGPDLDEADDVYTASLTTEGLDEDDYVLTVTATDKAGLTATETIDFASTPDIEPPVITEAEIIYTIGVFSARFKDPIIISATVTDNVLVKSVTVSDDLKTPLIDAVSMLDDDDGIYTAKLALPAYVSDTYELTITAADDKGNKATEIVLLEVTTTLTGYNVPLEEGWNLISLPLIPDYPSIETVLAGISGSVDKIWMYKAEYAKDGVDNNGDGEIDDSTEAWLSYSTIPEAPNDLFTMVDGKGYWIDMDKDETLAVSGVEFTSGPILPPTYHVFEGWNLIGFKSVDSLDDDVYLRSIKEDYAQLYGYDPDTDSVFDAFGETEMDPGYGYWIYMTAEGYIATAPAP